MTKLESAFFDRYKQLNQVCSDVFSDSKGVTQYIQQMEQLSVDGRNTVSFWDSDYRTLKRLRHVRNEIAHNAELSSCTEADLNRLAEFYGRLLNGRDALSYYHRLYARRTAARQSARAGTDSKANGFLAFIVYLGVAFVFICFLAGNIPGFPEIVRLLPAKEATLEAEGLPAILEYRNMRGEVESVLYVEAVSYVFENETRPLIKVTITGGKTYEADDASRKTMYDFFSYKLYDSEGYMVNSGNVMLKGLSKGDSFRDNSIVLLDVVPGEAYVLKLTEYGS